MNQNEASFYNQAIMLAKMGHREQAYSFFKNIAFSNPNDLNVIFWLVYTAPSLEKAQEYLDRAHFINPESPALRQANQWLTNEKLRLPQPAEDYNLFPPPNHESQVISYYSSEPVAAYYASSAVAPYYPPPAGPYQPYPTLPYYQAYPVPYQAGPPAYPQPYYGPGVSWSQLSLNQNYPPVRWDNAPAYLARGGNYRCPYCNSAYPPLSNRRISTGGWITFGVLVAIFFPLAWIGLLMQENYLRCSNCRLVLT